MLGGSSIGSSKVDDAVSLNEVSCILDEDSQLVDCIFESNFSILAELVNKSEGSRIATALGFHRIIMNSNALIRIDLNDKSHTIRYSNPGRHNLKSAKMFLCWNNEILLDSTSSALLDKETLEVSPDYVFLAIDLPVALLDVLVSIAAKTVSNRNQEKLLWRHEAIKFQGPQVETNPKRYHIGVNGSAGGKKVEKRNPVKKSVHRRVSWNSLHHLKK